MDHKVTTALIYLKSLLNPEKGNDILLSIGDSGIRLSRLSDITYVEHVSSPHDVNPIKQMFDNINEYMCTDCIKIDRLYKDDFFISLVKSYIESLIHEFGIRVAIPTELALAIVKHHLSDYTITYRLRDIRNCSEAILKKDTVFIHDISRQEFYLNAWKRV